MYALIIFDVDGTFYDLNDVVQDNYKMQVDFYAEQKGIPVESVKALFSEKKILPYKSKKARSATEFFLKNGIEPETWRTYREAHTSVESIRRETSASNDLIKKYAEQTKLVLLSSNSLKNIQNTLEWLGIDQNLFEGIFCSSTNMEEGPFSKNVWMSRILEKYQIGPAFTLSIGDRYESDIRPLVELGGDGALVETPAGLEEIFWALSSGALGKKAGKTYQFFEGDKGKGEHKE